MNAANFLVSILFETYILIILLRVWLQLARADFYNPMSQFIVKATQPVVRPLRRVIPSIGGLDLASVVFAYAVACVMIYTLFGLQTGAVAPIQDVLLFAAIKLLKQCFSLVFYVLILRAILSWVSKGNSPIENVLSQLSEPILSPIRRIIPAIGGLDLSMLVAILGLQFLQILIGDLTGIPF
ncbi:MAG: YggT family protein [Moritella dasanensis]|jgi:YggT family protein